MEDVTKEFEKKEEENKAVLFNLEDEKDREELENLTKPSNEFFKMEENVSYKVELTDTRIVPVIKEFEKEENGEKIKEQVSKYAVQISAKGSDNSKFEGQWEVGQTIMNYITKNFKKDVIFNVSRTGTGMKTRYSITKDF